MNRLIFIWKKKEYAVPLRAYVSDYIVLPNRTVLKPIGWAENFSSFPILFQAEEISHEFKHASLSEIVEIFPNAVLAREND